jgi:RNA polymerase sigma factor (sigma-70 family)
MLFENFINVNEKLLWSIVNNTKRKYFSNTFHKFLLKYYDVDDLYQELLTKLFTVYDTFDVLKKVKHTTYFTTICVNHLYTLMQPYGAKKNQIRTTTNFDLKTIVDSTDYELLYVNKMTIQEIKKYISKHRNKAILELIVKGISQKNVANDFNVSKQYINKVWLDFIKELKEVL